FRTAHLIGYSLGTVLNGFDAGTHPLPRGGTDLMGLQRSQLIFGSKLHHHLGLRSFKIGSLGLCRNMLHSCEP
ncbi:MAG: hypothetical protein M3R52_02705, partial [Acidobacteriota bacterium]|nr:hypothetical protein [Acidobacteriota bacterium]